MIQMSTNVKILALAVLLALPVAGRAQLSIQPTNKHSSLIGNNGLDAIRDDAFAQLMAGLLITSGTNHVRDAKFLFQECYGGGMLDDLQTALGTTVKWVGGSASAYDQPSVGQVTPLENETEGFGEIWEAATPMDFWTIALVAQLSSPSQTLLTAINNARDTDAVGVNAPLTNDPAMKPKIENGQSVFANGGNSITLFDKAAGSHCAILWAGNADHLRHYNDILQVRNALLNAWGPPGPGVTIITLFGNGTENSAGTDLPTNWNAQAATLATLTNAVHTLQTNVNTNTEFLFYASDHGETQTIVAAAPANVPAGGATNLAFGLEQGEMLGLEREPAAQPYLTIDYLASGSNIIVTLNGTEIGVLGSTETNAVLDVPVSLVSETNQIELENFSGQPLTVNSLLFDLGQVDSLPGPSSTLSLNIIKAPGSNQVTLEVQGEPGHSFQVQMSTNLISWQPWETGTLEQSTFQFQNVIMGSRAYFRTASSQFMVTSSAQDNGSITPDFASFVNPGGTLIFTATPDSGYAVDAWYLDGVEAQAGGSTYSLNDVESAHNVEVTFQ
jgi:hypothetical protein